MYYILYKALHSQTQSRSQTQGRLTFLKLRIQIGYRASLRIGQIDQIRDGQRKLRYLYHTTLGSGQCMRMVNRDIGVIIHERESDRQTDKHSVINILMKVCHLL